MSAIVSAITQSPPDPEGAPPPRIIAVAGTMGAGKSSLVAWLEQQLGMVPFFEPNDDNPYLEDFYADMSRWAMSSQLFFLVRRFRIHRQVLARARAANAPVVQDRTIYEDVEVFAAHLHEKGHIDDRDWGLILELYETLTEVIRPPDLLIYLRCPLSTLRKRIKRRGRSFEQNVPLDYLRALERLYEAWFERYEASPTIVIETDRLDYVESLFDRQELLDTIRAAIARRG